MTEISENITISEKTSAALGLFDGFHHGHRRVLDECRKKYAPAVFTFRTESVSFKHGKPMQFIFTNEMKLRFMAEYGVKYVYSPDFGDICSLSGEEFVKQILLGRLNAARVVCGEDFRFGSMASCGTDELKAFGEKYGFEVVCVPLDGFSAGKYRKMLTEGRVKELAESGDSYILSAAVDDGNRIGRTLDFPTINQHFAPNQLVPRCGVYVTQTLAGGRVYPSVTNIGFKPTVGGETAPLAETHIIGYSGDLYGRVVDVSFMDFVREEKKFGSLDELRAAIAADTDYCREYLLRQHRTKHV